MVDLGIYEFKDLNTGEIKPEELFPNNYAEEIYELEHVRTATKRFRVILDAKYENANLNKTIKTQCQHMTEIQRNELLNLLQKSKSCSMKHLVTGKQIH